RLVGEGDGEDLTGTRAARGKDMGNAGRQHPGFSGAGASKDQNGPIEGLDGFSLLRVEASEIRGLSRTQRALRDGKLRAVRPVRRFRPPRLGVAADQMLTIRLHDLNI